MKTFGKFFHTKKSPLFIRTKTTPNSPRRSVQVVENFGDNKTRKVKTKDSSVRGYSQGSERRGKTQVTSNGNHR